MKLNKLKSNTANVKVDHPLAKYNSKGDLYCLLCNSLIKNANVWKVHLSSKSHKDKYLLFKSGKLDTSNGDAGKAVKRAPPKQEAPPRSLKKAKVEEQQKAKAGTPEPEIEDPEKPKGILKKSSRVVPTLPEGFVPKVKQVNEEVVKAKVDEVKSNLPTGFFDENINPTVDVDESEGITEPGDAGEGSNKPTTALPDGFFDDAKADAKARKVEYKDPAEVEWEKFQSEMEAEDVRYNDILAEDDQKLREEREADIGIDQKLWDYRVESIQDSVTTGIVCPEDITTLEEKLKFEVKDEIKKEEGVEVEMEADVKMEDDSDSSDMEDDSLMDWRTRRNW
eukprot:sb/3466527/